jgi:hypothetical protein
MGRMAIGEEGDGTLGQYAPGGHRDHRANLSRMGRRDFVSNTAEDESGSGSLGSNKPSSSPSGSTTSSTSQPISH